MSLRLGTNGTQQDRIRPVGDNGAKIVDLRKMTHQQNQKVELSRVSGALAMRPRSAMRLEDGGQSPGWDRVTRK